ncbi:hypothetical protein [Mycobacterium sp.]|uniref:hypothetical protein n=1 Tax=Mycobacterium sp. TaxID=1785 RepID=UPI003BA9F0F2
MTSFVPRPPGWKPHLEIPTSQKQAQDTIIGYLQQTINALPPGISFEHSRGYGGSSSPCQDDPVPDPTYAFADWRWVVIPPGIDPTTVITHAGNIWRSWGWWAGQREDWSRKPNQFGYAPNGYTLQIEAPGEPGKPLTIIGGTPCFPGDIAQDNIPTPDVITAD